MKLDQLRDATAKADAYRRTADLIADMNRPAHASKRGAPAIESEGNAMSVNVRLLTECTGILNWRDVLADAIVAMLQKTQEGREAELRELGVEL